MIQKMNAAAAEVDKHWHNVLQMLHVLDFKVEIALEIDCGFSILFDWRRGH
jgi:hypothetical protein